MIYRTFVSWRFCFFPFMVCLLAASCGAGSPGEQTLLLYARSHNVYREGRFGETAKMLAAERNFAPALVLRGKAEYFSGDSAAAEKSFKRALALNPHSKEASLFLARLSRERGDEKEARSLVEKILVNNPSDIQALRFSAELARERGVSGEATWAALLDRAVEASAESALVFLDRARLRWIGGNISGALDDLRRARALLSDDSPALNAVKTLESIISGLSL